MERGDETANNSTDRQSKAAGYGLLRTAAGGSSFEDHFLTERLDCQIQSHRISNLLAVMGEGFFER